MLVEKNRTEALKAFQKGKTVKVITSYEKSEILEDMNDLIPEKDTHYLVDVPSYEDPEFSNLFAEPVKKFCINCFRSGRRNYNLTEGKDDECNYN